MRLMYVFQKLSIHMVQTNDPASNYEVLYSLKAQACHSQWKV
jgi:hypothetical protein